MLLNPQFKQLRTLLFPSLNLIYTAAGILVEGDIVFLNKFGVFAFYVEIAVLGIMFARLGTVVTEILDVLKSDLVFTFRICDFIVNLRFD